MRSELVDVLELLHHSVFMLPQIEYVTVQAIHDILEGLVFV